MGDKRIELINDFLKDYEKELLDIGANVNCWKKKEMDHLSEGTEYPDYFMPLKVFLEQKDDFKPISIYSKIWTLDSFLYNGELNVKSMEKFGAELPIMMTMQMNLVTMLNDYALEIGVNQETINERFDQFNRLKETMFMEYEKLYPKGTPFQPTKDEIDRWRAYAREELGVESDFLFSKIFRSFRWISRSNE